MTPKPRNSLTPGEKAATIALWLFVAYLLFRDEIHGFVAWAGL